MIIDALGNLVKDWFNTLGYGGIILAMALESCLIPLPSEIIMPVAGTFIATAAGANLHFNLVGVGLAGAVGNVLGSAVAYWIGATGGRPFIFKYGKYILVSRHDFDLAEHWFNRFGGGVAFFSRLLPIIRTYISLPAGMARMDFPRFLIFTFLGALPWSIALAYAGQQLGDNFGTSIGKILHNFDYAIAGILVVLVALYVWRHIRNERAYNAKHATQSAGDVPPPTGRPAAGSEAQRPANAGTANAPAANYGAPRYDERTAPRQPGNSQMPPNASARMIDPHGPDAPTIKSRIPPQR